MTEESRVIQDCIRKLAGIKIREIFAGEVTSVDEDNRTCEIVSNLDDESITYEDVNLSPQRNDGFIQVPAIGSTVICCRMPDGDNYVIGCSDIDAIICYIDSTNYYRFDTNGFVFNGGLLGGMAKTGILKTKYNNLESKINALIAAILAWTPTGGDGGAALKVSLATWLGTTLTATTQAEIEDNKIKH